MLKATELAGFIGVGLAGAAYVPQIWHLISERCSAGLSRVAFGVWLAASLLVTTHAVAIGATVFIVLGAIQLAATAVILVYATRYEHSYCASHLPLRLAPEPGPALPHSHQGLGGGAQLDIRVAVPDEQTHLPQTSLAGGSRRVP